MWRKDQFSVELVLKAYASGVFPMGNELGEIRWYSPDPRCIFDLKAFHVPKRLARTYRHGGFECQVNSAWKEVLDNCAERDTTWITDPIKDVYTQLHDQGFAHSVEVYKDKKLAGGLYGVSIGGAFMGESMFHHETDASKVALMYLVERLNSRGYVLLDCQFMTPHLAKFGALNIPRQQYLNRLAEALSISCVFE